MFQELSVQQKLILYRIAVRQDEQGRQPTYIKMVKLAGDELYQGLVDLNYLDIEQMGHGEKAIGSLVVTTPGLRYCYENLKELAQLEAESRCFV